MTSKLAIRTKAAELGFDQVGFTCAELPKTVGRNLTNFLDAGKHGEMQWLEKKVDRRKQPNTLWPEARTIIVLGVNYGPEKDPLAEMEYFASNKRAMISVYARNNDYHDIAFRISVGIRTTVLSMPIYCPNNCLKGKFNSSVVLRDCFDGLFDLS